MASERLTNDQGQRYARATYTLVVPQKGAHDTGNSLVADLTTTSAAWVGCIQGEQTGPLAFREYDRMY